VTRGDILAELVKYCPDKWDRLRKAMLQKNLAGESEALFFIETEKFSSPKGIIELLITTTHAIEQAYYALSTLGKALLIMETYRIHETLGEESPEEVFSQLFGEIDPKTFSRLVLFFKHNPIAPADVKTLWEELNRLLNP